MRRAAAIALAALAIGGCHARDPLVAVDLPQPDDYFAKNGYVELIAPVRPPTDAEGRDHIRVWLKLPKRGVIDVDAGGRLRFVDETVVERVESIDDRVVDVRGMRFDDDGPKWLHVYRRVGDHLVGVEWPRDDRSADKRARARIDELVRTSEPEGPAHDKWMARWTALADCAACHTRDRQLFVPPSLLVDSAPIERHRPRDLNVEDHFMTMTCVRGSAMIAADREGGKQPRCTDGEAPRATLDVPRALAVGDAHARAVCASRRWLAAHGSDPLRARFAAAIAECPER